MTAAILEPYKESIKAFCRRWKIQELSLFGSILGESFNQDSDIDFLVTFYPNARLTLIDWVHMEDELKQMLGRDIDLVSRKAVESSQNWIRKRNILSKT